MSDGRTAPPRSARLVEFLIRRSRVLIPLVVVICVAVSALGGKLRIDNSLRIWFLPDDPALASWDRFKATFGNDEVVLIAATDPKSVFEPAALERVRKAVARFEALESVRRVTSLVNGRHIEGDAVEIRTVPLLPDGPATAESAAELRRHLAANPVFSGVVIGKDEHMTVIVVEPRPDLDMDVARAGLIAELRKIATEELTQGGGGVHFAGMGVVYDGLNEVSIRDSTIFTTASYLVVFIGLGLLFRRLLWVGIAAAVVTLAVLATFGVAGMTGRSLNMVTAILPTFIMTIGVLDLVHFVESYDEGGHDPASRRAAMVPALAMVMAPAFFNTLTDITGFASLVAAPMSAIRDLGWLASVGLGFLFFAVVIIAVPALAKWGGGKKPPKDGGRIGAALMAVFARTRRQPALVAAVAVGLAAASVAGIMRLQVDTYSLGFLPPAHPVRTDHRDVEERFGPFIPYEFTITAKAPGGVKEPELLRRIDRMERVFEKHPQVGRATGLPDIVARVNEVVMEGEPDVGRLPDTREAVAQELLLYESDAENELDALVDPDYRTTRVTVRSGLPSARAIEKLLNELLASGQKELGDLATLEVTGYIPLYVRIIRNITDAQVWSFSLAFLIVTVVLIVLLRSVRLGLLALLPNLLPAGMVLGFMGFAGIRLDVATVLIASIVLGLAVNDTTHIFFRFQAELAAAPGDRAGAIARTLNGTGRAVVASSLILAAGFAVLCLSQVASVSYLGLLTVVAILCALVADLVLTPVLLLFAPLGDGAPRGRA